MQMSLPSLYSLQHVLCVIDFHLSPVQLSTSQVSCSSICLAQSLPLELTSLQIINWIILANMVLYVVVLCYQGSHRHGTCYQVCEYNCLLYFVWYNNFHAP